MSESRQNVKPYLVNIHCDDCKDLDSTLIDTLLVSFTKPPTYRYECVQCGKRYDLTKEYPYVDYEKTK